MLKRFFNYIREEDFKETFVFACHVGLTLSIFSFTLGLTFIALLLIGQAAGLSVPR